MAGNLLYSFFKEIDQKISDEMMLGIYVAVLTDTGSFRHNELISFNSLTCNTG